MKPGYNAPNRIAVDDCMDVFTTAEFTYQILTQENMELGFVNDKRNGSVTLDGKWINPDFEYKPGFKIGLGVNLDRDHWSLHAKYAWCRGTHRTSKTIDPNGDLEIYPFSSFSELVSSSFTEAKQTWRFAMDIGDVVLARRFAVGESLSFHPFLALRAAWIRQHLNNTYGGEQTRSVGYQSVVVRESACSWALGPRLGFDLDWALGCGFTLYGVGAEDLLFTRYSSLNTDQKALLANGLTDRTYSYQFRQRNVDYLRNHLDLELGFGWDTYFARDQWHIDFRAGYVFEAFFDQNMFRVYPDDLAVAKSSCPNGNLFVHGLSVKARLDF